MLSLCMMLLFQEPAFKAMDRFGPAWWKNEKFQEFIQLEGEPWQALDEAFSKFELDYHAAATKVRAMNRELAEMERDLEADPKAIRAFVKDSLLPALAELTSLQTEARLLARELIPREAMARLLEEHPYWIRSRWFRPPQIPVIKLEVE